MCGCSVMSTEQRKQKLRSRQKDEKESGRVKRGHSSLGDNTGMDT